MELEKVIRILEALAAGYSPTTGEQIHDDSVLNERDVIRALQFVIDHLKEKGTSNSHGVELSDEDVKQAISFFSEQGKIATPSKLAAFLLGTRKFNNDRLLMHPLYGKYVNKYSIGQMLEFLSRVLPESRQTVSIPPYRDIDFFRKDVFNKLSDAAVEQLKQRISDLGMKKTENLSPVVVAKRKQFPRAYEPWSSTETDLLKKAIEYTNDLDLLSICFQRAPGSIESVGQRILFEAASGSGGVVVNR